MAPKRSGQVLPPIPSAISGACTIARKVPPAACCADASRSAWYVGYSPLFLLAAAMRRAFQRPPFLGSMMIMAGYLEGFLRHRPRVNDPDLIRFIRRQQMRRLLLMDSQWS
jgi:hypothetical protein